MGHHRQAPRELLDAPGVEADVELARRVLTGLKPRIDHRLIPEFSAGRLTAPPVATALIAARWS